MKLITKLLILALSLSLIGLSASAAPSWQIVYYGTYSPQKVDYVILDLFGHSSSDVQKAKNVGAKPVAYFSAHYEGSRPDSRKFQRKLKPIGNWKNDKGEREYYIDWRYNKEVMQGRLDLAKRKGYWGVDIDNVDGPNSLPYFAWLYSEAKKRGLAVGLKNCADVWYEGGKLRISSKCNLYTHGRRVDFFVTEASDKAELAVYSRYGKPIVRMYYGKGAKTPAFIYPTKNKQRGSRF